DDSDRNKCVSNLSYHLHPLLSIVHSDDSSWTDVKSRYQVAPGTLHWTPNSPDMNIIEPIWVAFQCAVQKRSPPPGTPMDLRAALQDSWCEKCPGYLQTLVDTMPRRAASLLCALVGPKRY
ncbi:hypothetical protein AVEN_8698-1, partial [Araneus ventricosus]